MKILNISEVLPAPIKEKEAENNILLVTADRHSYFFPNTNHLFIVIIPFVSHLTSLLSNRWKAFRLLALQKEYTINQHNITVVSVLKRGYGIRMLIPLLDWISFQMNKKTLLTLVKQHHPDVIHAHDVHNAAYLAQRLSKHTGIPYLITTRKITAHQHRQSIKNRLQQAHAIISINHIHDKIVKQLITSTKSFVLPHGLDDAFLQFTNELSHNYSPVRLISICRLIPLKNIDKVLLALDQTNGPFIYTIYGDGPEISRLKSLAAKLSIKDKVYFKGALSYAEVPNALSQHDIFILPSYPETLGRVYFEAMSIGLPVIAAKNTGIDGYIENGVSGFLVDHHNTAELSNVLSLVINNPVLIKEMAKQAQMNREKYSWKNIIHQLNEIYSMVVQQYR